MSPLGAIRLVAWRDMAERIRSRAFVLSTLVTLVAVVALIAVPWFVEDKAPTYTFGFVGEVPESFLDQVGQVLEPGAKLVSRSFESAATAEESVLDGNVDLVVVYGFEIVTGPSTSDSLVSLSAATLGALRLLERAEELGLSQAEVLGLAGEGIQVRQLAAEEKEQRAGNRNVAFFGTFFLFISIVTYGQWILVGVMEEKTTRVVEVVLGAVRPHRLLAGKVIGIGALGLMQLVLISGAAFITLETIGVFEVPPATGRAFLTIVLWFPLGFALYATAFAAAGSLISRQEEAQNASLPVMLPLLVGYFIGSTSFEGDNPVLRIASLIPPTAPVTMPIRMAMADAAAWEVVGSVALMIITTYALIRLSGRVYSGGLLHVGTKIKLRQAWRSAEM